MWPWGHPDVIKTTFNKGIGLANCQFGYCGMPANESVSVVSFDDPQAKQVHRAINMGLAGEINPHAE